MDGTFCVSPEREFPLLLTTFHSDGVVVGALQLSAIWAGQRILMVGDTSFLSYDPSCTQIYYYI